MNQSLKPIRNLRNLTYLSKETVSKIQRDFDSKNSYLSKFHKVDSSSTIIENPKISTSFNSEILAFKLRTHKYKRAESELRQILKKPLAIRNKSEVQKKHLSFARNSIGSVQKKTARVFDSSLNAKEAKLILEEYNSIRKPEVWGSIVEGLRANPKHLLDLVPISLTRKGENLVAPKSLRSVKHRLASPKRQPYINPSGLSSCTPDIVETLRDGPDDMTEDWARSLLHHNIKHNLSGDVSCYSESELEQLLIELPGTSEEYNNILTNLLTTLESLLMELLGTMQDFLKFKEVYCLPTHAAIKSLAAKCLDLINLKKNTTIIIFGVIQREKILKRLKLGDVKAVIEVHKISNALRVKIQEWLRNPNVPFKEFIYKGKNYLEKMDQDLLFLQKVIIKA